ncbi:MAG TPA: RraA family protein [Candidatus Acidoferrum sp.]|nr:RraA family protein [Candidatus Acidoferrum sp.]
MLIAANDQAHDAIVTRLARVDACALSDALDALRMPGTVTGIPQRAGGRRIAGRCITVKLVPSDQAPPRDGEPRHLCSTAIEAGGPGTIVVVEQRTGIDAGSWGGILTLAAKVRKIEGVIADGPVRDIDEARQYDFPVFARTLTAFTARGRVAEAATNVPVTIGSVSVEPGDYALADNSGVVFVRAAEIERVLATAERLAAREAAMAKALLSGERVSVVMGANYETMLVKE